LRKSRIFGFLDFGAVKFVFFLLLRVKKLKFNLFEIDGSNSVSVVV